MFRIPSLLSNSSRVVQGSVCATKSGCIFNSIGAFQQRFYVDGRKSDSLLDAKIWKKEENQTGDKSILTAHLSKGVQQLDQTNWHQIVSNANLFSKSANWSQKSSNTFSDMGILYPMISPSYPVLQQDQIGLILPTTSTPVLEFEDDLKKSPMLAIKRTYQPHTKRRRRKHGFLVRLQTSGGRRVLNRRRTKGRKFLSA